MNRKLVLIILLVLVLVLVNTLYFNFSKEDISGKIVGENVVLNNQGVSDFTLRQSLNIPRSYQTLRTQNGVIYSTIGSPFQLAFDSINQRDNLVQNIPESQIRPNFKGYIIELKEKPLLVKKLEVEEEIVQEVIIEENIIIGNVVTSLEKPLSEIKTVENLEKIPFISKQTVDNVRRDVQNELQLQKNKIEQEHNNFKNKAGGIIFPNKITGLVVSNEVKEPLVLNEYVKVFNGIVLNINKEEADEISKFPEVKRVTPNYKVNITLMDSIPLINADDVWKLDVDGNNCATTEKECLTGKGVTIGIIDTGVDYTHTDLGSCLGTGCKVIGGYDFANTLDMNNDGDILDCYIQDISGLYCESDFSIDKNNDGDFKDCYTELVSGNICEEDLDPMDDHGHGTHVAATAAGNGVLKGIAPDADIYAYKVLDSYGSGSFDGIIAGIERSVDPNQDGDYSDHLDVISLSLGTDCFGGYTIRCGPDDPASQAIDNAVSLGVVAVIAAGNSGPNTRTIGSPGTAKKAITIGASYNNDSTISSSELYINDNSTEYLYPHQDIMKQWNTLIG